MSPALTFPPDVTAHDFEVTLQHVPALLAVSRSASDVSTLECPLGPASTGLPDAIWTKCGLPKAYCNLIAIPDSGAVASCMSEALFNALTKIGGVRTDVRPSTFLKACGQFKTLNSTRCKITHYVPLRSLRRLWGPGKRCSRGMCNVITCLLSDMLFFRCDYLFIE
jgi:hypothetical protein